MSTERDYGTPTGAVAANEPRDRGDERRQQAQEVKASAQEQSRQTAETAKQQAGRVGEEAKSQARDVVAETKQHLRGQAEQQTGQLAELLRSMGDNLQALLDGRADEAGPVGNYAEQALQRVRSWADQVDNRGFDGLIEDAQRFARRRPGAFLAVAAGAGFAVGRLGRGARDAQSGGGQQQTPQQAQGTVTPAAPTMVEPTVTGTTAGTEPVPPRTYPPATGPAGTEPPPAVAPDPSATRFPPEDR